MARILTQKIEGSECIGTSLHTKINPNFESLDTGCQVLSAYVVALSTVAVALSSSAFYAININRNEITDTKTLLTDLSTYTVSRANKAWVKFDGSTITTSPCVAIFSSFNVLSVVRLDLGSYEVGFTIPMRNSNYATTTTAEASAVYTFTLTPTPTSIRVYSHKIAPTPTPVDAIISVNVIG